MSFADKWLRYVREERKMFVHSIISRAGAPNDDLPIATVKLGGGYAEMSYGNLSQMENVPDIIRVEPIDAETVEITAGLYVFEIAKNGDMKIRYITAQNDLSHEDEKRLMKNAKNLGYNPTVILLSDV